MYKKIVYSFIIYGFFGLIVSLYFGYNLHDEFKNLLFLPEVVIAIIFAIFLFNMIQTKKIEFKINSIQSFIAFFTIVLLFLIGFVHALVIYTSSFFFHKITKKDFVSEFKIINKSESHLYQDICLSRIWIKSNQIETAICTSAKRYNSFEIGEKLIVNYESSFFGFIVNSYKKASK